MNAYTQIASVNGPAIEWMLANWPELSIVILIALLGWKYMSWLDKRFETHRLEFKADLKEDRDAMRKEVNEQHQNILQVLSLKFDAMDQKFTGKIDLLDQKFTAKIDALDQKFTGKLEAMDQKFTAKFEVVDQKLIAMDQKFTAKFEVVDQKFYAIEQRFTSIEKRLDKIDDKLEIQTQINIKLFTLLDANQKTIIVNS